MVLIHIMNKYLVKLFNSCFGYYFLVTKLLGENFAKFHHNLVQMILDP
jgi:hypothetical protein